jgi:hypothetical protein
MSACGYVHCVWPPLLYSLLANGALTKLTRKQNVARTDEGRSPFSGSNARKGDGEAVPVSKYHVVQTYG